MFNITDKAAARLLLNAITGTGAAAPSTIVDAHTAAATLSSQVRNLHPGEAALAAAVAAALEAGRDPAADPDVQRILTAAQLANDGLTQHVDAIAYGRFRDVCRAEADAVVHAWRAPFDQAAATLTTAHRRVGQLPLDDTADWLRHGSDIGQVWADAQAAAATVATITAGWSALVDLGRLATLDPRHRILRLAAVDYDTWHDQQLAFTTTTPWQAVLLGLPLSLPTPAEYQARVRHIENGSRKVQPVLDPGRSHIAGQPVHVDADTGRGVPAPAA